MKPLSERDENTSILPDVVRILQRVGMKPLSERDENSVVTSTTLGANISAK